MIRTAPCSGVIAALDDKTVRLAFGLFATGVTVVAAEVGAGSYAVSVNAVRSLSFDPALVLLCPRKTSRFGFHIQAAKHFTVNVLRDDQQALATLFSGLWRERVRPPYRFVSSEIGLRLDGALISLGCAFHRAIDAGAYSMIIGHVVNSQQCLAPHQPLLRSAKDVGGAGAAGSERLGRSVRKCERPPFTRLN
jgi:flavin reductase (DIM6/NTAB) family NADH-FMN oxidoreductase RutF